MEVRKSVFQPNRTHDWTRERIDQLSKSDIEQLRRNAAGLGETSIVELCDAALQARPKSSARARAARGPRIKARHLISRGKAFEARGVHVQDPRSSWSGVRKSDGAVVMSIWSSAVQSAEGGCSVLLWAPNRSGTRPWSDTAAGKERLEHCRLALQRGAAEGLLVYGDDLDGFLPEHKARSVRGVDPETVVTFQVEQRGDEYWGVWGRKAGQAPL